MYQNDLEARGIKWRKARGSANDRACVEVAPINGHIAVRGSGNPGGNWLQCSTRSWHDFISVVKSENVIPS
jgi:hypothetical protein